MLMGTFLFGLIICLTSCEDILGTWDKPTPAVVTPSEPETPEEKVYSFSLRNLADDADVEATAFNVTDQDGNTIVTAESDGKYTIKSGELSSVTTLWLEATTATGKYIAKATKEELPAIAEAGKLKMATLGDVILSDGKFAARTSTTGTNVAMIAYLGSETDHVTYKHGLALALTDEASTMNWSTATGASGAAAHTPAAPTTITSSWMLPSKDQWNKMIDACKNVLGTNNDYQDLRGGFSGITGASNLQSGSYWSSTATNASKAARYTFGGGSWASVNKVSDIMVRACLAF